MDFCLMFFFSMFLMCVVVCRWKFGFKIVVRKRNVYRKLNWRNYVYLLGHYYRPVLDYFRLVRPWCHHFWPLWHIDHQISPIQIHPHPFLIFHNDNRKLLTHKTVCIRKLLTKFKNKIVKWMLWKSDISNCI